MGLNRITIDPNVMQGKPCVRGMRITVGLVLNLLANGMSVPEVIRNYPDLENEDVLQCLGYAARLADERVIPYNELSHAVSR